MSRCLYLLCLYGLCLVISLGYAQPHSITFERFTVHFWQDHVEDQSNTIMAILAEAEQDLAAWDISLPEAVSITIYPDLASYQRATGMPYTIMALSNRDTASIHTQRIGILLQRGSLEKTLRHELFHLAQPEHIRRWQAEALAMRFAKEVWHAVGGENLHYLSDDDLDRLLAQQNTISLLEHETPRHETPRHEALMHEVYRRGQQLAPRTVLQQLQQAED